MSLLEEAKAFDQARRPRPAVKHPPGWTPGINTEKGEFVVAADDRLSPADVSGMFAAQMIDAGLQPSDWVLENNRLEMRTWPLHMGDHTRTAYYFKARMLHRTEAIIDEELAELKAMIDREPPLKRPSTLTGEWAFIVALADWQLGKRDGDGTKGVVERVKAGTAESLAELAALRKAGWEIGEVIIVGLGDLVEGCTGFYPMQEMSVELDRRGQERLARRLLTRIIKRFAKEASKVRVVAVGGNHGENRKDGKAFTSFADNSDVAVFEEVAEILAENEERYGHVEFLIPNDELNVTIQVGDTILGLTHGHVGQRSGNAGLSHTKVWNMWKEHSHGGAPLGDADVLLNGHFHYFNWCVNGRRDHIQVPALDHSTWFEMGAGADTRHGMVTFLCGPRPVECLRIHPCQT